MVTHPPLRAEEVRHGPVKALEHQMLFSIGEQSVFAASIPRRDSRLVFSNMRADKKCPQIRHRRIHIDNNIHPVFSLVPWVPMVRITGWDTISHPTSGRQGGIHKRRNRRWRRSGSAEGIFHTASLDTHTRLSNERAWW